MSNTTLQCKLDKRRAEARRKLNGIDYIDVCEKSQTTLFVYFLGSAPTAEIRNEHIVIEGGRRIDDVKVTHVAVDPAVKPYHDDKMIVEVDKPGDFSTYTLRMVAVEDGRPTNMPFPGFDVRYAHAEFQFRVDCQTDIDCKPDDPCPPPERDEPEIDYLAKDYVSFRQLILDRLALVMPDWRERHVPDVGIALVEILAYVGDHLSYYQDAVATEAYLNTARKRISVRRHARLVDYTLHEGCNARAWVTIDTTEDLAFEVRDIYFVTTPPASLLIDKRILSHEEFQKFDATRFRVFEPLPFDGKTRIHLRAGHSSIEFYTWGDSECCLPKGASRATLCDEWRAQEAERPEEEDGGQTPAQYRGHTKPGKSRPSPGERKLNLAPGDVLILEEIVGPRTGNASDRDPAHRHAVRLTRVTPGEDKLLRTEDGRPTRVVEVEWSREDALPFPLCISTQTDRPDCRPIDNVSVARGNVILVDHGSRIEDEPLGTVPVEDTERQCDDDCRQQEVGDMPGTLAPRLNEVPLTFSEPLPEEGKRSATVTPATQLIDQDPRKALPRIDLCSIPPAPDGAGLLFEWDDTSDTTTLTKLTEAFAYLLAGEAGATRATNVGASETAIKTAEARDPKTLYLFAQLSEHARRLIEHRDPAQPLPTNLRAELIAPMERALLKWEARAHLLSSFPLDRHYVVEMDDDRRAHLRFGNGDVGRLPEANSAFFATYRVGNGPSGNVGAETITHLVHRPGPITGIELGVRNPLPATGGVQPETSVEAKLLAPDAFRGHIQRAITPEDYATIVKREFGDRVQRAAATLRWTGSWYEALVAVDPIGGPGSDPELPAEITRMLTRYRRIAHDVSVVWAKYVPLDIRMRICVAAGYLPGHVKAHLMQLFGTGTLPNGTTAYFHPDNLTFGQGVFLSQLIATAQAADGVQNVVVETFERLYEGPDGERENGVLSLGPFEVARVDNDPSFPENGRIEFIMEGGR